MDFATNCPNCTQPMESHRLDRHLAGEVTIDLCFPCHVIWFDRTESLQLAPQAVIELFKLIHQRDKAERRPLDGRLGCPRCRAALVRTSDFAKSGRFIYYRCAEGHGRLTPFFQFLREKQFVRSLTPGEFARVRAEIRQVRCSSCGAPVDLERSARCTHCATPLAVLDADAVEKAVRMYSAAAAKRAPDPGALDRALQQLGAQDRRAQRAERAAWRDAPGGFAAGRDLVDDCINLIAEFLD